MDTELGKEIQEKKRLALIYKDRFEKARKGIGFHNCAGFTKYLLGLTGQEIFIRTGDPSEKGLIRYLEQKAILHLNEFSDDRYLEKSRISDAVALLHNN